MKEKVRECKHGGKCGQRATRGCLAMNQRSQDTKMPKNRALFARLRSSAFLQISQCLGHHTSMRVERAIGMIAAPPEAGFRCLPDAPSVREPCPARLRGGSLCPCHAGRICGRRLPRSIVSAGQHPSGRGLHDCGCILCFVPGTPSTSLEPDIYIPAPLLRDAGLSFATGVSATHGRRETTNLSTGPPAL